jgi:hypothetical protein
MVSYDPATKIRPDHLERRAFIYIVGANLFDSLFRGCLGPSLIVF